MKIPSTKLLAVVAFASTASTSAIAAPRTLANGAPAPGNTVAKGDSSYSNTRHEKTAREALGRARTMLLVAYTEEREAVAALVARPRVLASGAPACGNAVSKPPSQECNAEMADQYMTWRIERLQRAGAQVESARMVLASAEKRFAKYGTITNPGGIVGTIVEPTPVTVEQRAGAVPAPVPASRNLLKVARADLALALQDETYAIQMLAMEPRVLANGAPACGNTGSKAETECTTATSDADWKMNVQRLIRAGVAVRATTARVAKLEKRDARTKLVATGVDE